MGEVNNYVRGHKVMHCIVGDTIKSLVDFAAEHDIPREDVIGIYERRDRLFLVYYYGQD
jgi:hypothetical protein